MEPEGVTVQVSAPSESPAPEPQIEEVQTVADSIYEEVCQIKTSLQQFSERMTNSPNPELSAQIDSLRTELRNATERHRETMNELVALRALVEARQPDSVSQPSLPLTLEAPPPPLPEVEAVDVAVLQEVETEPLEKRRKHRVI